MFHDPPIKKLIAVLFTSVSEQQDKNKSSFTI